MLLTSLVLNASIVKGLSCYCSSKSLCKVSIYNYYFKAVIKGTFIKFSYYKIKGLC